MHGSNVKLVVQKVQCVSSDNNNQVRQQNNFSRTDVSIKDMLDIVDARSCSFKALKRQVRKLVDACRCYCMAL